MLDIVLETQIDQAIAQLDRVRRDQLPFAISLAVNRTALAAQHGIRAGVAQRFILRRPQFVLQTVRIEKYDFANKRRPTAFRIKIDERESRDFLAKFETGGKKESLDPTIPIPIPSTHLRATRAELVPRRMYPRALRLFEARGAVGGFFTQGGRRHLLFGTLARGEHRTGRGVLQIKGKRRTFILDPQENFGVKTWGVYQRTGSGKGDVRLLWTFKRRIPIPSLLRFEATARDVVERRFQLEFAGAYARAIATARPS